MKRSVQALVLITVLLAPAAAMAGEFEITPFLGYQFSGEVETFWCYGYNNSLYQFDVSAGLIIRFGD